MYVFPKKVTYLGGQVGNHAWKWRGHHWAKTSCIGKPTGHNFEICFASVLFSLDEWILCSDNQNLQSTCPMDKWSEKTVFYPGNYAIFHPDDQTQPTFERTPGFKPLSVIHRTNQYCIVFNRDYNSGMIKSCKDVSLFYLLSLWIKSRESRISSRYLEITSVSLIYSLSYSRKKELLF